MVLDWDDVEGNTRRRLAGLAHEKARKEEEKRKRAEQKVRERVGGVRALSEKRSKIIKY